MARRLLLALLALATVSSVAAAQAPVAENQPRLGNEYVLMRTNRGDLVLSFYVDIAPKHTAQILKLVKLGAYDTTYIHRVEPNFVAQITNVQNRRSPITPEQLAAIVKLPAEFSSAVKHAPGLLSMAREDGDINSAESSFSFMLGPAPHLDGKYTIFGQVEFGRPLLAMIAGEPRDAHNGPRSPIIIERAEVLTGADYVRLRTAGALRGPLPRPAADVAAAEQAVAADFY
jgi:cyclophilin family peptidyl-prolyl cis-trans isomerase